MKNYLLITFTFLALGLASCSNDPITSFVPTSPNTTLNELSVYNKGYLQSLQSENCTTRANRSDRWNRILTTGCYDIIGAAIGIKYGQIIGAGLGLATGGTGYVATNAVCASLFGAKASHDAWRKNKGYSKSSQPATNQPLYIKARTAFINESEGMKLDTTSYIYNNYFKYINIPQNFAYLKDVGENHNTIIKKAISETSSQARAIGTDYPITVKPGPFLPCTPKIPTTANMKNLFYSDELITIYNTEDAKDIPSDYEDYINSNIESANIREALKLYLSLYTNLSQDGDEIISIINKYIETIEKNNDFSKNEKEEIYAALIVSLYSPQLWKDIE